MSASRTSRRPRAALRDHPRLAMAALAAGVGAVLALAGCSAGQITQTATQVAPVPGADVDANESLALRNLVIEYNGPQGYAAGDDAPLVVRIFNSGMSPVTLTGVTADKAAAVNLVGTPTVVTPTTSPTVPPATASPEATESPEATGSPDATDSPEATGSPEPTETPEPTQTPTPEARPVSVTIPPQSFVLLVPGEGDVGHLVLTGLTEAIVPGESVTVTFTFDDGTTVTVPVPLAPPVTQVPRATPIVEPGHGGGGH